MRAIVKRLRPLSVFICIMVLVVCQLFIVPPASASTTVVNEKALLRSLQLLGQQHCVQPPSSMNIVTLSDAQLSLYGFPLHATLDKNPAYWAGKLAHVTRRTCGSSPESRKITHHRAPGISPSNVSELYSLNWSGNVAYGSRGTYRDAMVDFYIPSISGSTGSHVSFWAGVGGDSTWGGSSTVLVQAGVDITKTSSGQSNESWWEVWPDNLEQNLPLSRLNTGDEVYAYISSNDSNDGYDYFLLENETVGSYNSYTSYNSSYFSDSATGECIGERPTINGSYSSLANFGTEQLYGCYIETSSTGQGIDSWPHDYYIMEDSSGNYLATVGSISNTTDYPLYWQRAS